MLTIISDGRVVRHKRHQQILGRVQGLGSDETKRT